MSEQTRSQNPALPMDDQLPVPVDPGDAGDLVWAEFCGQFTNYDHRASKNRQAYQWSTIPLNPAK